MDSFEFPDDLAPHRAAAQRALETAWARCGHGGGQPELRWFVAGTRPAGWPERAFDAHGDLNGWMNFATRTIWVKADQTLDEIVLTIGHEIGHLRPEVRAMVPGAMAEAAAERWGRVLLHIDMRDREGKSTLAERTRPCPS